MAKFDDKVNGNTVNADEYNNMVRASKNLIEDSGQTIDSSNTQQSEAVANYVGSANFYTDSGVANAYVLSTTGSFKAPTALVDGLEVRFRTSNPNTGASTINVAGLGNVDIKEPDGVTNVGAGFISSSIDNRLRYDAGNNAFIPSLNEINRATETLAGIAELATQSEVYTGTDDTRIVTPLKLQNKINNVLTDLEANDLQINNQLNIQPNTATISSRSIIYTGAYMVLDTEAGTSSDELTTIHGGVDGDMLLIRNVSATRKIIIKHNVANIVLHPSKDATLSDSEDSVLLRYDGPNNKWINIARSLEQDFALGSGPNGYTYLPNGLIFQWGYIAPTGIPSVNDQVITFPIAFNNVFHIESTPQYNSTNGIAALYFFVKSYSTSQVVFEGTIGRYWLAIGN